MKNIIAYLNLFALLFIVSGCEYFSTSTHTPQQIKKASKWSAKDQPPSFESCEDQPKEDQFSCFKNTISSTINTAIFSDELIANQEIDLEIVLLLSIDKQGMIRLEEIENASTAFDALPELSALLESAVSELPYAIPAMKTNVGEVVDTTIKLPIRISAIAE